MNEDNATVKLPTRQIVSCGDISCEFLIDPIARPKPAPIRITLKPELERVVLVSNRKPNSTLIMRNAQAVLRERGIEVEEEIYEKHNASISLPLDMVDKLAATRSLVLCGVAD